MAITVFPLLIAIIGLLIWLLSSNAKASEAGKLMFFSGVLALCLSLSSHTVKVGV